MTRAPGDSVRFTVDREERPHELSLDQEDKTLFVTKIRDLARDLWFDADGNLMQFRFVNDGATLTFTRSTPLD